MSATQPLYQRPGLNRVLFSKEEQVLAEAALTARLCEELKGYFRNQFREYFNLMNFNLERENKMLEESLVRLVIKDILSTEEYTLQGIAHYTNTHEDLVHDLIMGRNTNPSITVFRKLIELHRSLRSDLYHKILKKITSEPQ